MKIAICDDMSSQREALRKVLSAWAFSRNVSFDIYEFTDGSDILEQSTVVLRTFDLIFLDIYMGQTNGIDTARALRERGVESSLVFLTASSDFAIEGYEVSALSYLVKPVRLEAFNAMMARFLQQYRPKSLFLGDRLFVIDDIVYAESNLKIVSFHFKDGAVAHVREKLDVVESRLTERSFLRCHKSYIVNMNYVARVKGGSFITTLEEIVPMRQKDAADLRKTYFEYLKVCAGIRE
ncbi:MAG: LytTR family DNA-binding domain-containing protein [Gordonibacter sp.]|nr:LytTR family DNA-binding domain-containing protein [Gordonibacter sp.]